MSSDYYEHDRPEVVALVPPDARRVLELGCASGRLAETLKQRQDCHVTGVEYSAEAAARAAERLDRVIVGDCESLELDAQFQPGEFDCLIAADVLEHLRDPESLLRDLRPFLAHNATIIVSLPNVRHGGVLQEVVEGYWTYRPEGILDRTHLRFFTRREIDNLFARLGFEVEERRTVDDPALANWQRLGCPASVSFGALTVSGLDEEDVREFFVVQWLFRSRLTAPHTAAGSSDVPHRDAREGDGLHPHVTLGSSALEELTSRLIHEARRAQRLEVELAYRDEQLANKSREADSLQRQLRQLHSDHASLAALQGAILSSISWRLTAPLRSVGALPVQLSGGIVAPLHGARRPKLAVPLPAFRTGHEGAPPVFAPRPITIAPSPGGSRRGDKGRLICISHVLPYPPRAGNEYRIHQMLTWLEDQGWDVLLLVCPLPNERISEVQIEEAAAHYANLIVCQRDGTVAYHMADGAGMLEPLRGRRPRAFGQLLHEVEEGTDADRQLLSHMRTFCPDVLIELLLHVESVFNPSVLLAEYVLMTRPFALLRPELFKIIDVHDVFSTKQAKVAQYGIDDTLAIAPEVEAELLNRGDLLIAIQPDEADELRKLTPARQVISVGVDFPMLDHVPPPASGPVVMLVASANPMNVKGLRDFLRFAWPLVRDDIPEAELHVIGSVGQTADPMLPGIRILGRVENLAAAYASARVIINPSVAGTGLKIKTVEALCHLRPMVLWPSGVDGLGPETRVLCRIATNWFDFAQHVIDLAGRQDGAQDLIDRRQELANQFAPQTVYAPLATALSTSSLRQAAAAGRDHVVIWPSTTSSST